MREINHATHLPTHLTSEAAQRTRFTTNEALASSSNPFPAPPQSRAVTMGPPPSGPQDNGTHAAAYYVSDVPADLLALPQLDSNPRQMTWEDYTPSLSFNPPHRPADLQFAYSNSRVNESTAVYGLPTPITAGTSSAQGNLGASPGSFYTGYDFGSEASAVPTRQMYPTYNTFGSGYPPATQQGYPMYHDNYATRSLETAPVFPGATSSFPMARSDTASHAPSEPLGAYPPINLYDLRGSFAYENEYAPTGPQNSFGPPSAPSYPYLPQPSSRFLLSNPLRHQAGLAHGIGSGYDVLSDHSSFGNPGYGSTNPRAPPPAPSSSNLAYRGRFGPRYAPAPVDPYIDYQQRAPRIQAGAYHPRTSFGQPLAPFPFGDLYASTDALGITTAGAEPATLLGTADFGSPLPAPQAIQTVSFHGVGATRASGLGSPFGETRGEEGDGLGRVGDDDTVDEEAEVERARGR